MSKEEKFYPPAVKKLIRAAYQKGYIDALVGSGSPYVQGVGLINGLIGKDGLSPDWESPVGLSPEGKLPAARSLLLFQENGKKQKTL